MWTNRMGWVEGTAGRETMAVATTQGTRVCRASLHHASSVRNQAFAESGTSLCVHNVLHVADGLLQGVEAVLLQQLAHDLIGDLAQK